MKANLWFGSGFLFLCCIPALIAAAPTSADQATRRTLQSLAITIEQDLAGLDNERIPVAAELTRLQRALDELRDLSRGDAGLARKHQAVSLLLAKLKYLAAHPPAVSRPSTAEHGASRIDNEAVAPGHGASCSAALGIATDLPVKLTLAAAAQAGSDAWLRFDPAVAGTVMFTTDSAGADPALEIFRDCASPAIAANDDRFGLDAGASAAAHEHAPLFVHLTNSGASGTVLVSVNGNAASINGTITDRITHQRIAGTYVLLLSQQGGFYGSTYTDANGNYQLTNVFAGSFYVRATAQSYVSELYPAANCLPNYYFYSTDGCDVADAQPVAVQDGQMVTGVDFALYAGQQLAGHVLDTANQPLIGYAVVTLFDDLGNPVATTNPDSAGNYQFTTLPPHGYKLDAFSGNYTSQMYDHVACDGALQNQCNLANANLIQVTNTDLAGVDFRLQKLASIHGTVNDTHAAHISYAQISAVDSNGSVVAQTSTDYVTGTYTVGPLGTGSYRVFAVANTYFSQAYAAVDCATADCAAELPNATAIPITQLGQQPQADFALQTVPAFSGHVQDTHGRALQGITIYTTTNPSQYTGNLASTYTDQYGNYRLQLSGPGQFFVWAVSPNYIDRIYPDIACESFNDGNYYPLATCDVSAAVLLRLVPGVTPGAFDFTLEPSARIAGNVAAYAGPGSQIPAVAAQVTLYDGSNHSLGVAQSDARGNYYFGDLPPGNYYAEATGSYNAYFYSQVWPNLNCGNTCIPTAGTPITVGTTTSTTGVDFSLIELDAVVGRVTDARGNPIVGRVIDLFSVPDGTYQGSNVTDQQGFYLARGNLGNAYFVATETGSLYIDQVYAGISCPLGSAYYGMCDVTRGTSVALSQSGSQPHIANFVLQQPDEIFANGFD